MYFYPAGPDESGPAGACEMAPTDAPGIKYCLTHHALHAVASVVCDGRESGDLIHLFCEVARVWLWVKMNRPAWPVLSLVLDVSEEINAN